MKEICIMVGRFQPLTIGHIKCCKEVYSKNKLPVVLLIIDTVKADPRHPFLTQDLMNTYKKIADHYPCIQDILLVKNADIVKNTEICRDHGYEPAAWVCGTDRANDYSRMASRYAAELNLVPYFEVFEIPRSDGDVSATECREAIMKGDQHRFEMLVPKEMHSEYFKLRKALEGVNESMIYERGLFTKSNYKSIADNAIKDEIMNWLKEHCSVRGAVSIENGEIYVNGSVELMSDVTDIPYQFGEVTGDFMCECKNLKSLKGCPRIVGDCFDCSRCYKISSLEGCPDIVNGNFWCQNCKSLVSLKGRPKEVGVLFYCRNCSNLISLDGDPMKVGSSFICIHSKKPFSKEDVKMAGIEADQIYT